MFEGIDITEEDIAWGCGVMGLDKSTVYGRGVAEERQLVLQDMGPLSVQACPGSGKTTLLVMKLAILARKWPTRRRGMGMTRPKKLLCLAMHQRTVDNDAKLMEKLMDQGWRLGMIASGGMKWILPKR